MATYRQRLHRKNASGGYDTIHLETSSQAVLMKDGKTLEEAFSSVGSGGISGSTSSVGNTVTLGNQEWIVVHQVSGAVYLMLKYVSADIYEEDWDLYKYMTLHSFGEDFYMNKLKKWSPSHDKAFGVGAAGNATGTQRTGLVELPGMNDVVNVFSYTKGDKDAELSSRIAYTIYGEPIAWWTCYIVYRASEVVYGTNYNCVTDKGAIGVWTNRSGGNGGISNLSFGYRPVICVKT